ncbi:hypothetical protein EDD11_004776 [Mortierella claussenii]|nr:hypothetical protein EDD11_004776 [Mortierella claussenii]
MLRSGGSGTGAGTRMRSGSNPPMFRDAAIATSVAVSDSLSSQRRAYRENSGSSNSSSSIIGNDFVQGASDMYPRSFLGETGDRHRASPGPSGAAFRNGEAGSPGTRARAATSSGYSGREQGTTATGTITNLSERSSYLVPMARERSSGATSACGGTNSTGTKSPTPSTRTHSHSISVPSIHSGRTSQNSTRSVASASSASNISIPPVPRYSTKPIIPVKSTPSAPVSPGTSTASPTTATSVGVSGAQGSSPLPTTSAVDLAGKRLREQQLQDRFKAAQTFIERTVGQPLPSNDLHSSLKDGVILCRLANRLRPGTVEQISLKNLPFVKMENISNFLTAARQLGVQSSDLFQTVDLYEGKDMTQVVSTILTLERVVGGVARMMFKDKRPGPSPLVSVGSSSSQIPKVAGGGAPALTRMRSKTANAPSVASITASIRPSTSSYYAAQVRKLEEDSIRFATGYDRLEATAYKLKDLRHQSTPMTGRATPPPLRDKFSRLPNLNDIEVAVADMSFESDDNDQMQQDAVTRQEQRDLVFGNSSSLVFEQSASISKSVSGPVLPIEGRVSALDMSRRKKKSISLDPQAANAAMGLPSYRDGFASPGSPGLLTQSASYSAISHIVSPGNMGAGSHLASLKQHTRFSSEKVIDNHGSPVNSRSTTPVQGLRKSANSVEPIREELELWENHFRVATYKLGNCIGRGQFGSVYKAMNMVTGQMVAVKRIKIDGLKDEERDMLMQEVDLLKSLAHPSIVKYEGFIKTEGYLNIILEFVENGSLLTTLKSFGAFPEKLVVAYVVKILEGLVYLHGKDVVHCDLKAANILTTKNGNVKLSDFGVSLNLKVKESDFGAVAGTPNWMAPEVIELKGASPASDIWSLGCTIIEMLTGRPPYADLLAMTTLFRIVEDERPPLPSDLSVDLLDFLCQCFQKDPTLRPSAGALGRHVWIKRNFAARELKPMDSLPYMKRKLMEPKEKVRLEVLEESRKDGNLAQRALTPLGLSSGAPPPAISSTVSSMQVSGRGTRRGSVDSAGAFYASSTVPAPTTFHDRYQEMNKNSGKATSQHQFVKSSFAKPVECRLCHDYVKKQAVICQDCSMVFHRKCQFYVGNTCFPGPHLSYFPTPTPAQSVPNLKMLANGKLKGSSRPSSRTSQLNMDDRSRSVTPSQGLSPRPCPTPPLSAFSKRETNVINEGVEQRRLLSQLPPSNRVMSPEGYPLPIEQHGHSQVGRPSSRQSDSPTSPTFSGLRNFISGPRRFSFSKKTNSNPLPTPSASYTSTPPPSSTLNTRQQAGTSDVGKMPRQTPTTPPRTLPVPIVGASSHDKNSSAGRAYRRQEYPPGPGPLDAFDDEIAAMSSQYSRSHQRPSSINIFSTSAPPVHADFMSSIAHRSSALSKYDNEDEQENDGGFSGTDDDVDSHDEINDMNEEDLEALLIPSVVRTPRSSIDAGDPVVVTNGHYKTKSQSFGQALNQNQDVHPLGLGDGVRQESTGPPLAINFGSPSSLRSTQLHHQQQPSRSGRTQMNNGYNSSGSSSAALNSSYSSQSNHSSSASSLGSVAALLVEEERMMKDMQHQQDGFSSGVNGHLKNGISGAPSVFQLATQPREAHHVGIKTMLNRFSASSRDQSTAADRPLSALEKETRQSTSNASNHLKSSSSAYTSASRHHIQSPSNYQQQHSQLPLSNVRSVHPLQGGSGSSGAGAGAGAGQKTEFAQGYDRSQQIQYTDGNSRTGWRMSSPAGIQYSDQHSAVPIPSSSLGAGLGSNTAASALKRGGKVIRRSMGVTLEKERWD